MGLEIRIYREITAAEPKVMWGMTWRQLAASALMLLIGGAVWLLFWRWLGLPEPGQWVVFLSCLPIALWGWWRPRGLKPEVWLRYVARHRFGRTVWMFDEAERPRRRGRGSRIDESDAGTRRGRGR